jgi:hypothetical protein
LHDNRSTEAPKNAPLFLGQSAGRSFFPGQSAGTRRVFALNRLVQIVCHPILVFGKLGEAVLQSLKIPDFIRFFRTFDQF